MASFPSTAPNTKPSPSAGPTPPRSPRSKATTTAYPATRRCPSTLCAPHSPTPTSSISRQRKYKAWIWDAEFRDTLGASVNSDGAHRYTVFVGPNGKRSVVVVNLEATKSISVKVDLPNPGKLAVATPEHPEASPTSGTLRIPARSAAVLMEL